MEEERRLSISLTGKKIPFKLEVGLFLVLDELHKALGGSGLLVDKVGISDLTKKNESPYELFAGTEFANETNVETPIKSKSVPYQEVYDTIDEYAIDKEKLIRDFNTRFPRDKFQHTIPFRDIYFWLTNENKENLTYR